MKHADETVWLSQQQMTELYQSSRTNIVEHIQNIYSEGELDEISTCRKFRQVRQEGSRQVAREIPSYNLDMIISVGYRIRSVTATRFRKWATERLKEYIIKGFTLDDERLKGYGGGAYLFLSSTGEALLKDAGKISHQQAMEKAEREYRIFQQRELSPVEKAYLDTIKNLNKKVSRKEDPKRK